MKKIVVISMSPRAAEGYRNTLLDIFGSRNIVIENVIIGQDEVPQDGNLYLVSKGHIENRLCSDLKEWVDFPLGMPVVDIITEFRKDDIIPLYSLEKGTRCLLVNSTEMLAMECISDLHNMMGVYHLILVPYCGKKSVWSVWNEEIDTAVTVDEPELVPDNLRRVINLNPRSISPQTIAEIAVNLKMEEILDSRVFHQYQQQFAGTGISVSDLAFHSAYYKNFLNMMIECLDDGIIGINARNKIFCVNQKAAEILGMEQRQLTGEDAEKALSFLPIDRISAGDTSRNFFLKYNSVQLNIFLNPIIARGKSRGILLVMQPFYEQEIKQNKARLKLYEKGYRAKYTFDDIIGVSSQIRETCTLAKKMAMSDSTVLIMGETGTGKELLASAIHNASPRSEEPYIAINCSAIADNLLESELFGYEAGAFTGAKKSGKPGLFEYAHRGTLFLDEIEDMSPALQLKLLRVLQEKEIMHIGGDKIIKVDVRIIAATNQDIEELVFAGKIRKDLYYRLNTLQLELPPLRKRREDILPLLDYMMKRSHVSFCLDFSAEEALKNHQWDGNIRELQNYVEYFNCLQKEVISYEDLPKAVRNGRMEKQEKPENLQILRILFEYYQKKEHIGRRKIYEELCDINVFFSEQQIRASLQELEKRGLVIISKGRGGSKLTIEGAEYCRQLNRGD